jgi:choline dehydrogenase
LTVALKTVVEKIIFDEADSGQPRAIGVRLSSSKDGPKYQVRAAREIVICAGTIATPHLLLLSGIGPKAELESVGVSVVKDAPAVGKNLVDVSGLYCVVSAFKPLTFAPEHDWGTCVCACSLWLVS